MAGAGKNEDEDDDQKDLGSGFETQDGIVFGDERKKLAYEKKMKMMIGGGLSLRGIARG